MSKRFERKPFDLPIDELRDKANLYESSMVRILGQATLPPVDLCSVVHLGTIGAAARSSVDPDAETICSDLRMCASAAAALFAIAASPPGQEIVIRFPGDQERSFVSTGWFNEADALQWERGFFAAVATRSHEAVEILAAFPMELLQKSTTRAPAWEQLRLEAFAAYGRRAPDALDRVVAASKATSADAAPKSFQNHILDIAGPSLDLVYAVMTRDQAAFDAALDTALKGHKHYYTRGDGKRQINGMIALAPLALCAVARDAGMAIPIESDYLPRSVLEGC